MGATITHTLVNSGTAVNLYGVDISYGWKSLSDVSPAESSYDIVPCQSKGFENPTINVTGVIDVNNVGTNELTQQLLINFATLQTTTPITFALTCGTNSYALGGRPSGGYSTSGTQTLGSTISVFIDSFNISLDSSSDRNHIWRYSINFIETR